MSDFVTKHQYHGSYMVRKMPNHDSLKPVMLSLIESADFESKKDPSNNLERINKYDFALLGEERPWSSLFYEYINGFMASLPDSILYTNAEMRGAWFQQYVTGDFHAWHQHPGSNFAGIYYLELPEQEVATEFVEPFNTAIIRKFNVSEGDVVLFPAGMLHRSPMNDSKKRKTVIAFNFDFLNLTI
jgi:hypothetical protein